MRALEGVHSTWEGFPEGGGAAAGRAGRAEVPGCGAVVQRLRCGSPAGVWVGALEVCANGAWSSGQLLGLYYESLEGRRVTGPQLPEEPFAVSFTHSHMHRP